MDQRKAEASYGIPDAELTPSLSWSAYSLRKLWNRAKGRTAPWWAENSKEAYSSGLANLATALGNYASRSGKRRGPQVRFPRIKGKRHGLPGRCQAGIRAATVSHRSGRWWVVFSLEITRNDPAPSHPGTVAGVDLGVKS